VITHPHEKIHQLLLKGKSNNEEVRCPLAEKEPEGHQVTGCFFGDISERRVQLIGAGPCLLFWGLAVISVSISAVLKDTTRFHLIFFLPFGVFTLIGLPSLGDIFIVRNPGEIIEQGGFKLDFQVPWRYKLCRYLALGGYFVLITGLYISLRLGGYFIS